MPEWNAKVEKEIRQLIFTVEQEPSTKVMCRVDGEGFNIKEFELDATDKQGLRQLLVKHEVLEAT